jgi:spore coat protein A
MRMGPAERLDAVVDFAGKLGQNLYLTDTLTGMQLLQLRVTQHLVDDSTIPPTLRALPDIGDPIMIRNWSFDKTAGHWTINGLRFDPNRVDARPVLGTTEKWVFTNPTGQPVLRNDESYAQKGNYVRENPVRAGLVKSVEDWPYQGEIVYIDRA